MVRGRTIEVILVMKHIKYNAFPCTNLARLCLLFFYTLTSLTLLQFVNEFPPGDHITYADPVSVHSSMTYSLTSSICPWMFAGEVIQFLTKLHYCHCNNAKPESMYCAVVHLHSKVSAATGNL